MNPLNVLTAKEADVMRRVRYERGPVKSGETITIFQARRGCAPWTAIIKPSDDGCWTADDGVQIIKADSEIEALLALWAPRD